MQWVRRIGRSTLPAGSAPDPPATGPVERFAPGLATFFAGVVQNRRHAVLDLGPAAGSSLCVYHRFARWVRFADVLTTATSSTGWPEVLSSLPSHPERPFDLVIAWDVLDRLSPEHRPVLVRRLAEISAPDARLFLLSVLPESAPIGLLRFTLLEVDRMGCETTPEARPAHPPVLPAEVKRILEPFQLVRAFSTQVGLRQYVAERRRNGPRGS